LGSAFAACYLWSSRRRKQKISGLCSNQYLANYIFKAGSCFQEMKRFEIVCQGKHFSFNGPWINTWNRVSKSLICFSWAHFSSSNPGLLADKLKSEKAWYQFQTEIFVRNKWKRRCSQNLKCQVCAIPFVKKTIIMLAPLFENGFVVHLELSTIPEFWSICAYSINKAH
jgi:hypothetical protein